MFDGVLHLSFAYIRFALWEGTRVSAFSFTPKCDQKM